MERIVIPGRATYSPVALTDLFVGAPVASRVLLGAVLPGQLVATVAIGYYAGSAARDWSARRAVRPIDFAEEFDADVDRLDEMPELARHAELRLLGHALNEGFTTERPDRDDLAERVDRALVKFIASVTGQEILTSLQIRSYNLARVIMPFASGTCDMVSGDVAIFDDVGLFLPHVIAHEFAHRKGYFKELHAQALAYMAMRVSGDPVLIQSARIERLHRNLAVLCRDAPERFDELLNAAALRPELWEEMTRVRPEKRKGGPISTGMKAMYDRRMRLSGQNGISDYDEGFTRFLWTFSRSETARQPKAAAAI